MNDNIKQILRTAASLLSYAGCIAVSLLIMYYLDGTIGIFLASALICAFFISLVLTLIALKSLSVEISTDSNVIAKGDTVNCIVRLSNTLPLPVPVVEIETECTPQFDRDAIPVYKGAVAGRMSNIIKIPMQAVHSGLAAINIKRIVLGDFLGIFKFPLDVGEQQCSFKVSVYPDIPDVPVQTDFLKTASRFSNNDDEEEESGETSAVPTGMAGYDHREYVPGDPIKRINWKLSSKRDIYMIRLDEKIRGTGQMFFLDCPVMQDDDFTLKVRDNVVEGALAMLSMLVREGRDAVFYFCADGEWSGMEIHEQGDVLKLQEMLADLSPCIPKTVIPADILSAGKTPICFTAAVKQAPGTALAIASLYPEALMISALDADLHLLGQGHWVISAEFEFNKSSE